jgi:hypothetical protein
MSWKPLSLGLGVFSIALGLAELLAPRKITEALDAQGSERLVQGFGVREIAAGAALIKAPAHSARVWSRVAGDALDLAALGLAARKSPSNTLAWSALAFVAGVTLVDVLTARGLDRETATFFT